MTTTISMREFSKKLEEMQAKHDRLEGQVKQNHDSLLVDQVKMSEQIVNLEEKVT